MVTKIDYIGLTDIGVFLDVLRHSYTSHSKIIDKASKDLKHFAKELVDGYSAIDIGVYNAVYSSVSEGMSVAEVSKAMGQAFLDYLEALPEAKFHYRKGDKNLLEERKEFFKDLMDEFHLYELDEFHLSNLYMSFSRSSIYNYDEDGELTEVILYGKLGNYEFSFTGYSLPTLEVWNEEGTRVIQVSVESHDLLSIREKLFSEGD